MRKEKLCRAAKRELILNNSNNQKNPCVLPSAEDLRARLEIDSKNGARATLRTLFDKDTFVELGVFTQRKFADALGYEQDTKLEGVITGYGAIDDRLVYAFIQDSTRMKGAVDEAHAKKICALYDMALKNGAPVIGIFDCAGADIFEGVSALAAYGRIMKAVSAASGVIPQIAVITGNAIGSFASIAAMYDFVITTKNSNFYVTPPKDKAGNSQAFVTALSTEDALVAVSYARTLLAYLPDRAGLGISIEGCADNLNRTLGNRDFSGDAGVVISSIVDNGIYLEMSKDFAPVLTTAFGIIGGVKCGIIATSYAENEGRLSALAARKAAKFVSFCDAFSIPLITLVDSMGLAADDEDGNTVFSAELAKLAKAYADSVTPKITVVLGHAIGASFVLLGSKALGVDVAYALDQAEISALPADASVAFAWNDKISLTAPREEVENDWRKSLASPVAAASLGEIDDIISVNELRARICSALLMLVAKGSVKPRNHAVEPF